MNTELFYPAPKELPVLVHPPRGSSETLQILERLDWNRFGNAGNGELLRAGALWLHGFLDESHAIAQGNGSAEGSYWHALMHRSEGDFSNSKYWYRRVGRHAIFPDLLEAARQLEVEANPILAKLLAGMEWDPLEFVNAVALAASHRFQDLNLLRSVARAEYDLLMGYCLGKP
ncbi:MAG: hypothetical protein L0387_16610 [Acidobacteria bacterium]|nr:hypothetical protein [Acidobacteriota bacterium]MCI0623252.1 hypothetical protein [Acidobacteriota bacterium]MCI0723946.1 hypothetical protein [Acidobacteriota bacterium]